MRLHQYIKIDLERSMTTEGGGEHRRRHFGCAVVPEVLLLLYCPLTWAPYCDPLSRAALLFSLHGRV